MGLLPLENGPQDHLFRGKLEQLFRLVITHSGKTQMDFAALMRTNRSNVARWILQLERMELISRTILPGTARTYGIHLTSQGRALALSRRFLALDGHAGKDGASRLDGHDGVDGGMDGVDGREGIDGVDGRRGGDGVAGVDGHRGGGGVGSDASAEAMPQSRRRGSNPSPRPPGNKRHALDGQPPAKRRRRS